MAAFTSGADWSFGDDIPGGWQAEEPDKTTEKTPIQTTTDTHQTQTSFTSQTHASRADTFEHQAASDTQQSSTNQDDSQRHWPSRQCRICLEVVQPTFEMHENIPTVLRPAPKVTYVSEDGGRLLRPCKCKGTQKYVHEECLTAWRLADPLQKRNYWECPTCRYRYHLQRLTWASYINSTMSQLALTLVIVLSTMFVLGFVADPIINIYLDPVYAITNAGGPTGSLIFEDEQAGWAEHFLKGLTSLGLLGFAKWLFTLSPLGVFNIRPAGLGGGGRGGTGNTGRDRINQIGWLAVMVGVVTFLIAVWKGVRAWSRKTLQAAGERVLDVPGSTDDDE